MSANVTADVCRVVLVAPHRTLELALPHGVPLADLMPVLVQRVTLPSRPGRRARRGRGLTGEGDWVLQRLGGVPLEEELTPAALQIRDGETLYLRPRDKQLPPAHFDDLIDGLATGIRVRADRWQQPMTRAMFLAICTFALGVAFLLLLDESFLGRDRVAGAMAIILVIGAMLCSRGLGDRWAALTLAVAAVPFAVLAGWLFPPRVDGTAWTAAAALTAAAAGSVAAMLALLIVGQYRAVLLAMWVTGVAASLGGVLAVLGLSPVPSAAAVVTLTIIATVFAPGISFRLARLRLPMLPTGADDLADDIEPYPAASLMAGARAADTYLTAISVAVGGICTAGVVIMAKEASTVTVWMIVMISLVLMVRSRGLTSAWQRGSALLPAVVGPAALLVRFGTSAEPATRLNSVGGLLVVAGAMLALSRSMPGRRLVPYWGRIVDFFEYVFAIALVVLLLAQLGVYQWARSLSG